jgi:hypothetical protein
MIDLLGFIYDVAKDVKDYLKWDEEEKLVDFNWPAKSGFQERAEADGLKNRMVASGPRRFATSRRLRTGLRN